MSTITRELAKLFRKITNSEIDAEGNAHVFLSPADSLLINNARIALASLEAEASGRNPVLAYADSYRDMAKQGVESIPVWSVITDLERNIAPLYSAPPAPVAVPDVHHSIIAEQLAHVLSNIGATDHQRAVISCAVDRLNKVSQLLQASPSALLVPEMLDYQGAKELYNYLMTEEETNATVNGWNACRAAMLQGSEPVTDNTNQQFESLSRGRQMNEEITLRDIIKAIVILKPGTTLAEAQLMIWAKTARSTMATAMYGIVNQGLFTTRRVENKGRPGFKCNAYYPTRKLLDSFHVTAAMIEYLGLTELN